MQTPVACISCGMLYHIAKMSFNEILDLTDDVFSFFSNIVYGMNAVAAAGVCLGLNRGTAVEPQ